MKALLSTSFWVLTAILFLLGLPGCHGNEMLEHHFVKIPGYQSADYLKMLDDPDADVVYNAICNLTLQAGQFGTILSADTIQDSVNYKLSKQAFDKISSLLSSCDEWVVCAAIRFVGQFGQLYNHDKEVINKLLTVKKLTKSTKLELIYAYNCINKEKEEELQPQFQKFLNEKNWLVSRYAFSLVVNNSFLTQQLIAKYKITSLEYEKLLILQAIGKDYNDDVWNFLSSEYLVSKNKRIKEYIVQMFGNASDSNKVYQWVKTNIEEIKKDSSVIVEYYAPQAENWLASRILVLLIEQGVNPASVLNEDQKPMLFTELYSKLFNFESQCDLNAEDVQKHQNLLDVETSLQKYFLADWQDYRQSQQKVSLPAEFVAEHNKRLKMFFDETRSLFDKYNVDPKKKDEYLKALTEMNSQFVGKK
jgi:hypothetical protein